MRVARMKVTDAQVIEAGERIARGVTQKTVAQDLGITGRALYARMVRLGVPRGRRGRPQMVRLQHCRTCRCKTAPQTTTAGHRGAERQGVAQNTGGAE